MNRGGRILDDMKQLLELFTPLCQDRETLSELQVRLADKGKWKGAHDLFQRIRHKTIAAERSGNMLLQSQYYFEEACAKTTYNLGNFPAPFDSDSPYWVVPSALVLAKALRLEESRVLDIVARPHI
jgi:hypothetical protein